MSPQSSCNANPAGAIDVMPSAAPNAVTAVPAPASAAALAHFASSLGFETDCWDVHDALASGTPGFVLLDVRSPALYVRGHVPGAINRPYAQNMKDGRFKSPMELAAEFRELLAGRDASEVVAMCGSGVTACHNLLAMERAGFRGAKLFAGSWSGWISDTTRPRPVATGA